MAANAKDFNCKTCSHRHCDDNQMLPGSMGPAPYPKWKIDLPGETLETKTCLLPMVTDQSRQLLKLGKHYHNGVLLCGGGILNQPNLYREAMELIPNGIY